MIGSFEIEFDFIQHCLHIRADDGALERIELKPRSVAEFYSAVMEVLLELKLPRHDH